MSVLHQPAIPRLIDRFVCLINSVEWIQVLGILSYSLSLSLFLSLSYTHTHTHTQREYFTLAEQHSKATFLLIEWVIEQGVVTYQQV